MRKQLILLTLGITFGIWNVGFGSDLYKINLKTLERKSVDFSKYKGKVLLVVNTASSCGYTGQLGDLQKVYDKYQSKGLEVLGFPSNDFKQETESDDKIAAFCKRNYGVKFTMFQKSNVNGPKRNSVYQQLIKSAKDKKDIKWNFEKFVVGRNGQVLERFGSSTKPMDKELVKALEEALSSNT